MGYALADAAARRGATVTLVSGPTQLDAPPDVTRIDVTTAEEMHTAVQQHASADLVLMAAAVADYTPAAPSSSKIKKGETFSSIDLRRTPDILKALGEEKRPGQTLVGFAMETDDGRANARRKLQSKNLDWIALNNLNEAGAGFGAGTNRITLIGCDDTEKVLPKMPKRAVAEALLDHVATARPAPAA
jgi:phosphopantothenoylcysteine decarboxylase / phosphopantothenate---cysteine ligase